MTASSIPSPDPVSKVLAPGFTSKMGFTVEMAGSSAHRSADAAGVAAIWLFVRLLQTRGFHRFAYYTWAVGALFLGWLALRAG